LYGFFQAEDCALVALDNFKTLPKRLR